MESYNIRKTNDWKGVSKQNSYHFCESIEHTKNGQAWFVWYKGFVVGFCTIEILECGIAYLTRVGVDPSHQGRGLHGRMLRVRENFARKMGCKKIITYTAKDNIKSIITLIKKLYQVYEPEYPYVGPNYYYFLKEL